MWTTGVQGLDPSPYDLPNRLIDIVVENAWAWNPIPTKGFMKWGAHHFFFEVEVYEIDEIFIYRLLNTIQTLI